MTADHTANAVGTKRVHSVSGGEDEPASKKLKMKESDIIATPKHGKDWSDIPNEVKDLIYGNALDALMEDELQKRPTLIIHCIYESPIYDSDDHIRVVARIFRDGCTDIVNRTVCRAFLGVHKGLLTLAGLRPETLLRPLQLFKRRVRPLATEAQSLVAETEEASMSILENTTERDHLMHDMITLVSLSLKIEEVIKMLDRASAIDKRVDAMPEKSVAWTRIYMPAMTWAGRVAFEFEHCRGSVVPEDQEGLRFQMHDV